MSAKPKTKAQLQAEIDYWREQARIQKEIGDIYHRSEQRWVELADNAKAHYEAQRVRFEQATKEYSRQMKAARFLIELTACRTGN